MRIFPSSLKRCGVSQAMSKDKDVTSRRALNVLIWNAHWETYGGGERYVLELGRGLSQRGMNVFYAGNSSFPGVKLKMIFGLEMEESNYLEVSTENEVIELARSFDCFINASFGSRVPAPIPNSIYICHFPFGNKFLLFFRNLLMGNSFVPWGFRIPLFGSKSDVVYVDSNGYLRIRKKCKLGFSSNSNFWKIISEQGDLVHSNLHGFVDFEPGLYFLEDSREAPSSINIDGLSKITLPRYLICRLFSKYAFIDSYKQIWTHSNFVSEWVSKMWNRNSIVTYPPVRAIERTVSTRNPYRIMTVGRFFDKRAGHSKNQYEIVKMFKSLCSTSQLPWELHLVGTVSESGLRYLEKVKRSAKGLRVSFHIDMPENLMAELYSSSSYYWHAAGLNQKSSKPERFEHFGISVVEAMSAGAIPFVYYKGGPAEILSEYPNLQYRNSSDLIKKLLDFSKEEVHNERALLMSKASRFESENFYIKSYESISKSL